MRRLGALRADLVGVQHRADSLQNQLGPGLEDAMSPEGVVALRAGLDLNGLGEHHVAAENCPGLVGHGDVRLAVVHHARRVTLAATLDVTLRVLVSDETGARIERVHHVEDGLSTLGEDDGVVQARGERVGLARSDLDRFRSPRHALLSNASGGDVGVVAVRLGLRDRRLDRRTTVEGIEVGVPLVVAGTAVSPQEVEPHLAGAQDGQTGVDGERT